ncbi:adenine specific DNA-methyltransferase, partial [mine drainage metagenome]
CGSGTTAAVAEKLRRKWIASDLGKFAIHTTRKRLIGVQRELKTADKAFRAFEVLNLGRYERQAYLSVSPRLSDVQREAALMQKERDYRELILRAYKPKRWMAMRSFTASVARDWWWSGRSICPWEGCSSRK